jgi:hypothetical protein
MHEAAGSALGEDRRTQRSLPGAEDSIQVAFILSANLSGSTWLNLVLGSHSWAANVGEYYRLFTKAGQVACRLCEANGLPECTRLSGFEQVQADAAFQFAARRLERRTIIDAWKEPHWCRRYLASAELQPYLVHLVRHPCGYMASARRREPEKSWRRLFRDWLKRKRQIELFLKVHGRVPQVAVGYDDLANEPARHFPPLCRFLGFEFEPAALRYWDFEHHGPGANGANSLYLRGRSVANFVTGDDAFYAALKETTVQADTRWRELVPLPMQRDCLGHRYVRALWNRGVLVTVPDGRKSPALCRPPPSRRAAGGRVRRSAHPAASPRSCGWTQVRAHC